jgi:hypothetical protein
MFCGVNGLDFVAAIPIISSAKNVYATFFSALKAQAKAYRVVLDFMSVPMSWMPMH